MKQLLIAVFIIVLFVGCTKETYVEGLIPQKTTDNNSPTTIITTRFFKNKWKGTYLATNNTGILLSTSSYSWQIEKVNETGNIVLVNKLATSSLKYLGFSGSSFSLISEISPMSSWKLEEVTAGNSTEVRIKHIGTGGYLHTETGKLSCGSILPGWLSAMWTN